MTRIGGRKRSTFTFRLHRSRLASEFTTDPAARNSIDRFLRAAEERPAGRGRWLCSSRRSTRRNDARRSTLRAICEASRGRQLRLIRAETDSGRSDGLLNALTCRQPSARATSLPPSLTTWPNFSRRSRRRNCARLSIVSFPVNPFAILRVLWVKADTWSYIF